MSTPIEVIGGDYRGNIGRLIRQSGTRVIVELIDHPGETRTFPLKHVRILDTGRMAESYTPVEVHGQ